MDQPRATPEWLRVRGLIEGSKSLTITRATESLRSLCRLKGPPYDMHAIARQLEVRLIIQGEEGYDHALNLADWARRGDKADWDYETYLCTTEAHPMDQRAGWAHQLGHLLFHPYPSQTGLVRKCHGYDKGPEEDRANQFAGSLLVPLRILREEWRLTHDILRLADIFDVRPSLVQARVHLMLNLHEN